MAEATQDRHPASGTPADARLLTPEDAGSARLALARTAFLTEGVAAAEVVREPILASWTRSRLWHVPVDHLDVPFESDLDGESALLRAARPVLREAAEQFGNEPVSVILCDANGIVLTRDTGDARLEASLDQVWLAPGFSYAEEHVGTNGIGTALEGGGPARVFGHEHYVEHLEEFACTGVPVRHPVTHKVLGVVDLTCWRRDAGTMMAAAASALGRRIEAMLLEHSGRREHALLHDYLTACRRNRDAVLAVGDDLLMLNDRARELLAPADQGPLLAEIAEALATGRRQQLLVDLPSGLTARVQCKPSFTEGAPVGRRRARPGDRAGVGGHRPRGVAAARAAGRGRMRAAVGEVPPVRRPRLPDPRVAGARGRAGHGQDDAGPRGPPEPDAGRPPAGARRRRVRAALGRGRDRRAGDGRRDAAAHPRRHAAARGDGRARRRARALPRVDRRRRALGGGHHRQAAGRPRRRPRRTLLTLFPRTVEVPPLRHHVEDVAELVPHLLTRLTRGGSLSVSPAVMRVLMRNLWPGNVEQLYQVLRTTVARRRSGTIELSDLPPECRATTRRVLTPLEAIECDAIVDALLDTDGNKAEAARQLGMSRATIYRKIRGYGLTVPLESA